MSLNDLLNDTFGSKKKEVPKMVSISSKKKTTKKIHITKSEANDLVIALNYAINSIKNKSDVIGKKEFSTRYNYFQRWTSIQEKLKEKTK